MIRTFITTLSFAWLASGALAATPPPPSECRPALAVLNFKARNVGKEANAVQSTLLTLITDKLMDDRAVRVVERERLQAILAELQMSDTQEVDSQSHQSLGKALAASIVVDGRFLIRGNEITVDFSCVSIPDGKEACAGTQTAPAKDIISLAAKVAHAAARAAASATVRCEGKASAAPAS